jgi:starch-binding outer membrane protein, SusD/RagB family
MKFKNIIILLGFVLFSACSDFLDVTPETQVSTQDFFQTQDDYEQAVGAIYAPLRNVFQTAWHLAELPSDNTFFMYNIANRGPKPIEDFATFTLETNNVHLQSNWSNNYQIISRSNQVLDRIEDADFDVSIRNNLKGQALFLRALAYFDLVRNFGDVPLYLESPTNYEETFKARAGVNDVYNQIISDASSAAELLPDMVNQNVGRATSGAALTLLGDVYLTLERWEDVESILEPVTNMNYSLLQEYSEIFSPTNSGNSEIIFEVEYLGGTGQSLGSTFPYRFIPQLNDPSIITGVSPASTNNSGSFNLPTTDLINAYEDTEADQRYSASIAYHTGPSPFPSIDYEDTPYIIKFLHPHSQCCETNTNWPVYRYAEVLLMLAEAINEQGNRQAEAESYLNEVRNRAGLENVNATGQDNLRELILHERRIELAFENKRWRDLVRTGQAITIMNEFGGRVINNPENYYYAPGVEPPPGSFNIGNNNLIYPIPITEISINSLLDQNPGY